MAEADRGRSFLFHSTNAQKTAFRLFIFLIAALPVASRLIGHFDRSAPLLFLPMLIIGWSSFRTTQTATTKVDLLLTFIAFGAGIAGSFLGGHPAPAWASLAFWVFAVAIAGLFRVFAGEPLIGSRVLAAISAGACLACLVIWCTWQVGTPMTPFPFYGHVRIFGLHMMIGSLCAVGWLAHTQKGSAERGLSLCVAVISTAGMLWSGGRTPALGLMAGCGAWLLFSPRAEKRLLVLYVPPIVTLALLVSWLYGASEPYLGWWGAVARSTAATSVNELSSTRWQFWQVTWRHILEHPWFGSGLDSYRFIVPRQDGDQPHNWVLQFLLDLGFVGGAAAAALLVWQALRGFSHSSDSSRRTTRAAAAGLTGCLAAGLLDGVFYHAVLLLPAMALAGIAGQPFKQSLPVPRPRVLGIALALAAVVLLIDTYLFWALVRLEPPKSPSAPTARLLRYFPSTVAGLPRWLDRWRPQHDAQVLEWARWAQTHDDNAARYHLYAAIVLADHNDFPGADREMQAAIATCHWTARDSLQRFRASIAAAAPPPRR